MQGQIFNDKFKISGLAEKDQNIFGVKSTGSSKSFNSSMSGFIGVYNYPRVEFNYADDQGTFDVKIGDE